MMRSTGGVKMNWPLVAIAFAVIGVPMGVAVIQDLGTDRDEDDLLAKIGQVNDISAVEPQGGDDDQDRLERADDVEGTWTEPAMDQAFFDEGFLGGPEDSKPALRGPLTAFRWDEVPNEELGEQLSSRWPRVSIDVHASLSFARRTEAVVVSFPDDGTAERVLTSRWGVPLMVTGNDGRARRIWSNRAQQLKLVLEQEDGEATATFAPYIPAAEIIAENGRFGFETFPILGATGKQLMAKYGSAYDIDLSNGTVRVECPGVEVSESPADCLIDFAGEKAVRITMVVDHLFDPEGGPQLFAALRARLGEPRSQSSEESVNTWTFGGGYTVTQVAGQASIRVERVAR